GTVPFGSVCEESITQNSSPIWTVDRAAWESLGGVTAATTDAPTDRKGSFEGTGTDETALGTLDVGEGRIVIFGAVLPTPSEDHPHWKGLAPYTVTNTGQHLLTRALTWQRESAARAASGKPGKVAQPKDPAVLPATGIGGHASTAIGMLIAAVGAIAARRRR
ncbi:MAG: LPXTG cell wall anchor domain-containing protein, partial [Actinomycetota bacterium]